MTTDLERELEELRRAGLMTREEFLQAKAFARDAAKETTT